MYHMATLLAVSQGRLCNTSATRSVSAACDLKRHCFVLQGFQLQAAARQGKLGLCVPDLPTPVPVGDNIGQPL